MIKNLFKLEVEMHRLSEVSGTKKEIWQSYNSNVPCSIFPIDGSQQGFGNGGSYSSFKMFCPDDVDVKIGDKVINGSEKYVVRSIKTYDMVASRHLRHKSLIITKQL